MTFQVGTEEYGLDISAITEVVRPLKITSLPQMPDFIEGVINLRGMIIPVVDLRNRFELKADAADRRKVRMIITRGAVQGGSGGAAGLLGLVVDSVNEVLHLPLRDIDPAPEAARGRNADFIRGMGKVGDRLIILLDITRILSQQERSALAEAGMPDLELLGRKLESSDAEERREAAVDLGRSGGRAVPFLFRALADNDWRVRKTAVEALVGLADEQVINGLVQVLSCHDNAGARNSAIEALVHIGPDAVETLLRSLGSPDPDVRKFIVDILGDIRDTRSVPALIERFRDEDENVRVAAAEALGKIRDRRAVDALLGCLARYDSAGSTMPRPRRWARSAMSGRSVRSLLRSAGAASGSRSSKPSARSATPRRLGR